MARYTKTSLGSNYASKQQIDSNLDDIKTAIDDTLSRKGDSPNSMEADLDMNSNQILNLPDAVLPQEPVTLSQFNAQSVGTKTTQTLKQKHVATAGQTVFTTPAYVIGSNNLSVYINGVRQDGAAYSETTTTSITLTEGAELSDIVEVLVNELPISTDQVGANNVTYDGSTVAVHLDALTFDTVAAMVAHTDLQVGMKVKTWGYYSVNDGGGAEYEVVSAGTGTDDGGSFIDLTGSSLQAKLVTCNILNASVYGIFNGATLDNTALQNCLDTGASIVELPDGDYSTLTSKTVSTATTEVRASLGAKDLDGSLFDKRFRRVGQELSSFEKLADNINAISTDYLYIQEGGNADRFYVFVPSNTSGKRSKFRFDRTEANFDDGGAEAGNRPYLLTQINRVEVTTLNDYHLEEDGQLFGTWIVSGSNKYSNTTNDKAKFKFFGDEISILYGRNTNSGIADIFIDGKPANLVPQLDMYGTAGSVRVTVADNLGYSQHEIEIVVTGTKNASSSDYRIPLNITQAYRVTEALPETIYKGESTDFVSFTDTQLVSYKNVNSAITYALGFRLASNGSATTPFIGSVHGYEELQSIKVYLDGVEQTDWLDGSGGTYNKLRSGKEVIIEHVTKLVHPDDAGYFADIVLTETMTSRGYSQSYTLTWLQDVTFGNGYTQMWVANGGLQGGVPGDVNGWCDHIRFNTGQNAQVNVGDNTEFGHDFPTQIIMYGSPYDGGLHPNREALSGSMAFLVSFPDLEKSMDGYKGEQAVTDGVWVNDRNTIKKLYVQPFRTPNKDYATGEKIRGSMTVDVVFSSNDGCWKAFS